MLTNCEAVIIGNDSTLLYAHHNVSCVLEVLQQKLFTLMQWFQASKLSLDLKKAQNVIFNLSGSALPKIKIISAKY